MTIRDCIYVSKRDAITKTRYFNKLYIQEEREYRAHLFFDLEGYFRVNREKHRVDTGFFTVTAPGDHYTVTPDESLPSQGYYLTIFELDDEDTALASYLSSSVVGEIYRLHPVHRFSFDELVGKIQSGSLFQRESARHYFQSVLYGLSETGNFGLTRPDGREAVDKAIRFMQERTHGEFRLDTLCGFLNLSVPHFIRVFKAKTGLPPMKYYTRLKVEEAVTLLMNSDKPLAAIAEELNFSSAAHFSKIFKQYMGVSPTQYRNNYINTLENRQERSFREIEKAYALLNNIIDESPDLVFYKDINGNMMGCNNAFCEIMGMTKEEIIGRSDYELFSREMAEFFIRRDEVIFRTNRSYKNEEWMVYPDGRRRRFEVYKAPFHDAEGKLLGLIGVSRDITEREKAS